MNSDWFGHSSQSSQNDKKHPNQPEFCIRDQHGKRDQLSLAREQNDFAGPLARPALTTINQPWTNMGFFSRGAIKNPHKTDHIDSFYNSSEVSLSTKPQFSLTHGQIILQSCCPLKTKALTEELYVFMGTEISLLNEGTVYWRRTVDHAAHGD